MPCRRTLVAALALALLAAARHAGTYHVYTCSAAGKVWPNSAWTRRRRGRRRRPTGCAAATTRSAARSAPARASPTTRAALELHQPGRHDDRRLRARRASSTTPTRSHADTHRYFVIYKLGGTVFAGAGDYLRGRPATALNTQKQWYGYPEGNVARGPRHGHPRQLPGARRLHRQRHPAASCASAASTAARRARSPRGGAISQHALRRRRDDQRPDAAGGTVEASGLLAGGPRNGSDPVTVTATDNAGIRRVELIDVTTRPRRRSSAPRTTSDGPHRRQPRLRLQPRPHRARASATRPSRADRAAGRPAPAGRAGDRHGRATSSIAARTRSFAATPSDRGALNGAGATETGIADRDLHHGPTRRPPHGRLRRQGRRSAAGCSTRSGQPIAGAKVLAAHPRPAARARRSSSAATDHRRATGASPSTVGGVRVAAAAVRLALARQRRRASRANGYLTLQARASSTPDASPPGAPRVGAALTRQRPAARRRAAAA